MKPLEGKTVLITGANGFIAGRLSERLVLEEGARVRVLLRNWSNASWITRLDASFFIGDVSRQETLREAVQDCEVVFHCASGGTTYGEYMETNFVGTRNLLSECQQQKVGRFVYLSSVTVHGCHLPSKLEPSTPFVRTGRGYSDSKVATEEMLNQVREQTGFPIVIIRPTFVWGPRANQFTVGFLNAIHEGRMRLIDGGSHACNAVYIDNLVDLLLRCGWHNNAIGNTFFSTDGGNYSWAEFLNGYAQRIKRKSLASLSSKSLITRYASKSIAWTEFVMDRYKGNSAPFWKRLIRRSARETNNWLRKQGVPDPWYLGLMSSRSAISLENNRTLLAYEPRISFLEAMNQTEAWFIDQLGVRFGLSDAFGNRLA